MKTLTLCLPLLVLVLALHAIAEEAKPASLDPRTQTLAAVHQKFADAFAAAFGNGPARIETWHSPTPFLYDLFHFQMEGDRQHVDRLNLVGMVMHDGTPVVFEMPKTGVDKAAYRRNLWPPDQLVTAAVDVIPSMPDKLTKYAVRAPDDYESKAIQKLQEGEQVVIQTTGDEIRMVGAIRAEKNCLECHVYPESSTRFHYQRDKLLLVPHQKPAVKEGDLLGAFTYRIKRAAPETKSDENPLKSLVRFLQANSKRITQN